jgi:hypothetical protein
MTAEMTSDGRWTASLFPGLAFNDAGSPALKPMKSEDILKLMKWDIVFRLYYSYGKPSSTVLL